MKRLLLVLAAILITVSTAMADKYTIDRENLPEPAREFLTTYFPKGKVAMIKVDRHLPKKTDYDVKMVDGTKIEFSNAGKWKSVEMKGDKGVPEAIIPKSIRNYVAKNYAGEKVTEIEKKSSCYEAELSAGIKLRFSLLGSFQKVVDMDN